MRKIGVIINTVAGSVTGQDMCTAVAEAFDRHGAQAYVVTAIGKQLRQVARRLRNEGFETIVAAGGDGTVSSVASQLVGHSATLGVLPLGTLNHFARDLKLPTDLYEAAAMICSGQIKKVDVGAVNDHLFINNSSLGLYPDQVRVRQRWRTRIGKWPALVVGTLIVLARFPYLRLTAEFNGRRIKRRCPMVLISNNEYRFEPANLTERDRLDRGLLGVYLLRDEGRTGLLRIALHSMIFRLEEDTSFESDKAAEVIITTRRRRIQVALDGELYQLSTPLVYRSMPGSLQVIAPA